MSDYVFEQTGFINSVSKDDLDVYIDDNSVDIYYESGYGHCKESFNISIPRWVIEKLLDHKCGRSSGFLAV